jgi:hypothetical protein
MVYAFDTNGAITTSFIPSGGMSNTELENIAINHDEPTTIYIGNWTRCQKYQF